LSVLPLPLYSGTPDKKVMERIHFQNLCGLGFAIGLASLAAGQAPVIGNCTVFPADNIWNTRIDQLPVSPSSATWVSTIGPSSPMHPDFGSGTYNGEPIGIPYVAVPGTQTKYPATFTYQSESDPGPYAVPLTAPIEGGSSSTGDRHVIAVDTDNCILYEMAGRIRGDFQPGFRRLAPIHVDVGRRRGFADFSRTGALRRNRGRRHPSCHPFHGPANAEHFRLAGAA
jgi:hypothetical protein